MNLLLNIIWLIFGGFLVVIGYTLGAILLCITIIGIPFGVQCFKLAGLALAPFSSWRDWRSHRSATKCGKRNRPAARWR